MSNENEPIDVSPENPGETTPLQKTWGMTEHTYCMLMHLSTLLSGSGFGIAVPIVLWAVNKDQSQVIDQHGKNVLNFIISMLIYAFASIPLTFVGIGIVTLIAIAIVAIVFPIIAAVKANDGKYWPYPLCIRFFK
ncbi:MAG: DUF4870 domain-containing protein [Planctomycetaceae bacterium]|nr:DUF4870 domain-containing protein [Planctomycetaceae bacterium]